VRAPARVAALPRKLPTNPYCELLYDHVERLGVPVIDGRSGLRWLLRARRQAAVLHLHWPERHFEPKSLASALYFVVRLAIARLVGFRLVWTVHNARPHDQDTTLGARLVRAALCRWATPIVHCEAGRAALGSAGGRAVVIPHGNYIGRYPNGITRTAARTRLGLDPGARVFLAFGQLRAYKGLDALVAAFGELDADDAHLVVAGERVGPDAIRATSDPRVRVCVGHVPDAEVQVYMNAADLIVLPYREVLTSGAAMLAFSFGRGIVAPRLGCLAELERSGAAILYDPERPGALAAALARGLRADTDRIGERARRFARALSWDAIARRHLAAYGFAPRLAVLRRDRPTAHRAKEQSGWT